MSQKIDIFEYRDYLAERYGEVLHRVPVDTGLSCPHRRGNKFGGCTFCPSDGARAVQLGKARSIPEQIQAGVRFASRRYKATAFMAYLQTFTNTFTSVKQLSQLVDQILKEQQFKAISFGTRPDCLGEEVIDFLNLLGHRLDVWVELGIQTCHDKSLRRINRGHLWKDSQKAIVELHGADISVAAHIILGLPGETISDNLETIKTLAALPIDAIKFHNLHIIKGTELAKQYRSEPFPVLNEHEYCELLLELLPYIPEKLPIIRLTTDTEAKKLLAPKWSMSKGQFRKHLGAHMRARTISQGCKLRPRDAQGASSFIDTSPTPVTTKDGSVTFLNSKINEHYHTLAGARSEAEKKYVVPAQLGDLLQQKKVRLLDVCFGLGYNSLAACEQTMSAGGEIDIIGLEMDRGVVTTAAQTVREHKSCFDWQKCLQSLTEEGFWQESGCTISLLWGDARYTISKLKKDQDSFDLIWLDPFSTQKNSELWTVDLFRSLYKILRPKGAMLTYCAAIPVRSGLLEAGFHVGETVPFGRDRGGTLASPDPMRVQHPLPKRDLHLIQSLRGIPYRDPDGTRSNKEILRAREFEILQRKQTKSA